MKKKNFLFILLICLIAILLSYIIFLGYYKIIRSDKLSEIESVKNIEQNDTYIDEENLELKNFEFEELFFEHCKQFDNCRYSNNTLRYVKLNEDIPKLNEILNKINDNVKNKYNQIINSSVESSECDEVRNIYNYRTLYSMAEYIYESVDYISIAYSFSKVDVCKSKYDTSEFNTYIYDLKNNEFIDDYKLLKMFNVSLEDANLKVKNFINNNNFKITYDEIDASKNRYFISREGNLMVMIIKNDGQLVTTIKIN